MVVAAVAPVIVAKAPSSTFELWYARARARSWPTSHPNDPIRSVFVVNPWRAYTFESMTHNCVGPQKPTKAVLSAAQHAPTPVTPIRISRVLGAAAPPHF